MVRVLLCPHPNFLFDLHSLVTCIYSLFSQHAADIFFLFFFHLFVASYAHGSRRPFLFFFLLSILGVVLLLLTKLTSSFTLLFPFFLFYLFCLPENLLGAMQRRMQVTHKVTNSLLHLPVCAS